MSRRVSSESGGSRDARAIARGSGDIGRNYTRGRTFSSGQGESANMQAPQGAGESPPPRHRDGKIHPKTLTPALCLLCAMPHFSLPAGKNLVAVPPETRVLLATASPASPACDRWPSRKGPSIGTRISRPEPHAARRNRGPHRPTRAVEISLGYPIDHHSSPIPPVETLTGFPNLPRSHSQSSRTTRLKLNRAT